MSDVVAVVATAISGVLTGSQKAASVLMGLHPDQAATVLRLFSASEVAEITAEMHRLGKTDPAHFVSLLPSL